MTTALTTITNENSWKIEDEKNTGYITFERYAEKTFDEEGYEEDGEEYLLISRLQVQRESRGNGLGRHLLRAALAIADELGLSVKLNAEAQDADTDEERLVLFYESEGFSLCEEQGGSGVFMER